jgi:hypothetical protein
MNDGKVYMTDRSGREFCIDNVHHVEITETEPKTEGTTRMLSGSFEATIIEPKIDFHTMHKLTGTESNNERRRHHDPMRRRKRGFYIFVLSSGTWIWKSVSRRGHEIKPYTHYGGRGQNDIN